MKKILSVVVPTYNMEALLPRCLDSLVLETDLLPYLQVIVVNDGSTDNSSAVAHVYEQKYPQTILVIDKENGNYGSCVNVGLRFAIGKYFRILDADDCFDSYGLKLIVNELKTCDADAVFTNYEIFSEGKTKGNVIRTNVTSFGVVRNFEEEGLLSLHPQYDFAMHKITYKLELLKKNGLRLTEGISYTDTEYVYYPMKYVNSVIFFDFVLYKYYVGRAGQTVEVSSKIKSSSHLRVIIDRLLDEPLPVLSKTNKDIQRKKIMCFIIGGYYHVLLVLSNLTKESKSNLESLDNSIYKKNRDLYERLSRVWCIGMPYIKIWRIWGVQIIKPWLYLNLKKIFK